LESLSRRKSWHISSRFLQSMEHALTKKQILWDLQLRLCCRSSLGGNLKGCRVIMGYPGLQHLFPPITLTSGSSAISIASRMHGMRWLSRCAETHTREVPFAAVGSCPRCRGTEASHTRHRDDPRYAIKIPALSKKSLEMPTADSLVDCDLKKADSQDGGGWYPPSRR